MTGLPDPADLVRRDEQDGVERHVAGAVVEHDGRVLVLRRPDSARWELPSGEVRQGEDLVAALRRGVFEETGLQVAEVGRYLGEFDHPGQPRVRQHTWSVVVREPEPVRLRDHREHAWIAHPDHRPVRREVRALIRQHQHRPPAELPDPWPFAGLVVRGPRLELRPDDDAGLRELALLGVRGVHPPEEMPLGIPWTDAPPEQRSRDTMRLYWRCRAELRPDDWTLNWIIRYRGRVIGTQLLRAHRFRVTREVETASWVGLEHQGRGFGTEARALVLALAFDHLGASRARTSAWWDNAASLRVSTKLGYRRDGTETGERRGEPTTTVRLVLGREDFERHRPDWPVSVDGLEPCLPMLGVT